MTAPEPRPDPTGPTDPAGPTSPADPADPVERLLVEALRTRADAVTLADLRPARPPSVTRPRLARFPLRRTAAALLGLAAAVAVALLLLGHRDPPAPPADQPETTTTCQPVDAFPPAPDASWPEGSHSFPLEPERDCPLTDSPAGPP